MGHPQPRRLRPPRHRPRPHLEQVLVPDPASRAGVRKRAPAARMARRPYELPAGTSLAGHALSVGIGKSAQLSPGADPSLVKILRRCHSTVRGLRYSAAAISGLVSPSAPAGRCGLPGLSAPPRLYRTFAYRLPGCCELVSRAIRERLNSHRGQRLVGRSQLGPGIGAAAFPAQPFSVEELRASELDVHVHGSGVWGSRS